MSPDKVVDRLLGAGVIMLLLAALVFACSGCRAKWDQRANGGELIEFGSPCNPCQPNPYLKPSP